MRDSEFEREYDVVFIIDHKFVFDTIKDLKENYYDFNKSFDELLAFSIPWEKDEDDYLDIDIDELKLKFENKEITEHDYMLVKCKQHCFDPYGNWFRYLNQGVSCCDEGHLTDVRPVDTISWTNYWHSIDAFDNSTILAVYQNNLKPLFTGLKDRYLDFLNFIHKFKTNQWCFSFHVYGTQDVHCDMSINYYEALYNKCKEIKEKYEYDYGDDEYDEEE